ncbi:MAG: hypothetical protein K2I91_03310 [Muribaculaceae bacterium]|nr:hypothetical protein [Muribaculaceae bacterium]
MKKLVLVALAVMSFHGACIKAAATSNTELLYAVNVLSRSTSRLYCGQECLTLYSNGKCVLTSGDSIRIEGTYEIKDGWVILYFNGEEVPCKATIGRDGSVQNVSYKGYVYRKR